MLQIEIHKSRSKNYDEAIEMALNAGAVRYGDVVRLSIDDYELFSAYNDYFDLLMTIGKWKTVKAYYKGEPVGLYRFILKYKFIFDCASERHKSDEDHCWQSLHRKGWGCRKMQKVSRYIRDRAFNYYAFGFFSKEVWRIDKYSLLECLQKDAFKTGCHLCPYFSDDKLRDIVFKELPESLISDDLFFIRVGDKIKHKISIDKISNEQMKGVLDKLLSFGLSKFMLSKMPGEKYFNAERMYAKYKEGYLNDGISLN